ncbi:MAG TPA: bifunctional folylpolyglutamate synthase/dihydrofolate synthase [Ligilactobacillus acidipiscis]|uniref:Dihydrofolate synthase/folylpolyglutamate synthase n=1 Tax=Ligilactobacillus acidipiscis TaxID=89059 RepID=A0A921F9D3_9LACO|nr:bifunctional folylpolyglutamate synthase/dihydrofolate synthase [Ligilactobacillus acidipiscis]
MGKVSNYEEALDFIHGRHKFVKYPTLKRMRRFAELLGNPQEKLSMIHVTGTNGKGSVTAYLRDLLLGEGYDVGTFTSPFIEKFNERISMNGKMVSDETILSLVQEVRPVVDQLDIEFKEAGGGPTEFEVITAMMFLYFSKHQPDFLIVEVGIGGTYDATNIIQPLISVITSVGMDHMQILGDTLAAIAENKAGIIKKNVPVICGKLLPEVQDIIKQKSESMNADLYLFERDFFATAKQLPNFWGETFDYRFKDHLLKNAQIQMVGDYQIENASVALTAFLVLLEQRSPFVPMNQLNRYLRRTIWPGRFEKLVDEPLIVLDGAHNLPAMQGISRTLKTKFNSRKIYVLLAVLKDKQFNEMIAELEKLPNVTLVLTTFDAPRATFKREELDAKWANISMYEKWNDALLTLINNMEADDMLLITGSLYFVSEVRKYFK